MQQDVVTVGDLAKNDFQVHAVGADGKVLVRWQLRRGELRKFFASLLPCLVGMEACASPYLWGAGSWRGAMMYGLCLRTM